MTIFSPEAEAGADRNVRGIDHIGMTVPDIERATAFLIAAFDAREIYDADPIDGGAATHAMLGLDPSRQIAGIRFLHIGRSASIELFDVRDADWGKAGESRRGGPSSLRALLRLCRSCEGAGAASRAQALSGPNELTGGEAGTGNRMNYIRTPWGTLIELISYPSGVADWGGAKRWTPALAD